MPHYKDVSQRDLDEDVIGPYRSILHTMTSELVELWSHRFTDDGRLWARNPNVAHFLQEFSDFSWAYFEHIEMNMPASVKGNKLQAQRDMRRVLNNLERTWGELLAVCNQRENTKLREVLNEADAEAQELYDCYEGYKPTSNRDNGTVTILPLTYFGTRFAIRRYPFTPFPLLSFRFEALGEDILRRNGLAHELGHFIYWNAAPVKSLNDLAKAHKALDDKFDDIAEAHASPPDAKLHFNWRNWKTEVFADIVGALLCGPAFIETSLRLFVEEAPTDQGVLFSDDAFHPYGILRPLIGLITLEELAKKKPSAFTPDQLAELAELRRRWEERYYEAMNPVTTDPQVEALLAPQKIKVNAAIDQTEDVVKYILTEPLWLDASCHHRPLYELFKYTGWAMPVKSARPVGGARQSVKSASFDEITSFLANRIKNVEPTRTKPDEDTARYRALIDLPLSDEHGWDGCMYVTDAGNGNGNYDIAGMCGSTMYYVIDKGWGNGRYSAA